MNKFNRKSIAIILTLACFLSAVVSPTMAASVNSKMTISRFSVPDQVTYGKPYSLSGTISSNLIISSVTINIMDSSNKIEVGKTVKSSSKSFDIKSKIDPYITFGKLSAGKKKIVVSATDAAGSKALYTKSFEVVKPSAKITFSSGVDSSVVSPYTLNVIKEILTNAGLTSATITSTIRTPQKQAEIMYANCERTGPKTQKVIYGSAGDKVIDVYIAGKSAKLTKTKIIENMVSQINSTKWPGHVSLHCVPKTQYSKLNVLDISQSSISNSGAFKKQLDIAVKNGIIKPYLIENECYHLEIPVK